MRIVIDLQGLQAEFPAAQSKLLESVKTVARQATAHDLLLVLNSRYEESILPIRRALASDVRPENIRVWLSPCGQATNAKLDQLIHQAFIANLQPDLLLLTDLSADIQALGRLPDASRAFQLGFLTEQKFDTPALRAATRSFDLILTTGNQGNLKNPSDTGSASQLICLEPTQSLLDRLMAATEGHHPTPIEINTLELRKPRMAYISPLPPERSGIADYSAELIPFLARYYDIDVVVDQAEISDDWIREHCQVLSMEDFEECGHRYQRILYHFGNNPMHVKMFELLERFPGIVVLHDFFLSGVQWYRETHGFARNSLWNELYLAHGYKAIHERSREHDEPVVFRYPCNFSVLQKAFGVIVHSENSRRLAKQWYGLENGLSVIPLLRHPAEQLDRAQARKELGISEDDFLVCSFGFVGKTKQNHRLLDAWEASSVLRGDKRCKLVYVGDTDDSPYAHELSERVRKYGKSGNVRISGWTDTNTYRLYLAAADVAVQLRTLSRGETSAAVLDCMNYAIATVINANGSMADIPGDVVRKIPDEFFDSELTAELEFLRLHPDERQALARRAQEFLHTVHDPAHCAEGYAQSIETFCRKNAFGSRSLVSSLAQALPPNPSEDQLKELSRVLALDFPRRRPSRTLFLDVSVVARDDFKTGIQRVVRALTLALIDAPPEGFRVEPVYLSEDHGAWHYRYAHDYTLGLLNLARGWIGSNRIEAQPGDILLGLDLAGGYVIQADREGVYRDLQNRGVKVSFVVYDLIPVQLDNIYPPGFKEGHADWLKVVAKADSAICISQAVAHDLAEWVAENVPERTPHLDIQWFHLGADLDTSSPSSGLPENAQDLLQRLSSAPSFLMVGTVEPRKGHGQALDAFERLWSEGCHFNLVVVGKEGWMVDTLAARFRQHPELGNRLHWLEGISDEYLLKVYANSSCLLAPSLGEGFGLPLIEAAQHKLPILARDLPVFREVAGEHAFYFSGHSAKDLSDAIVAWLGLQRLGSHPKSVDMPWLTWQQATAQLTSALLADQPPTTAQIYKAEHLTKKGTSA
ncbi:D-inositol-3-phosphate glycosyltransferase [compost metagenome]|uniref:Glycosyltransferase involved in cell wall bisynthesis n=1 Tax=Pseudomonas jinjuensis TaxID=198616 RepID=A0A1H0K610_9PSED|nr:glycosyltransferase [Pseudomonas jinjuensis]SDO51508.1 Glycosyltransferase involved in cell wall bisynthesis [Pseudomonas jinjuensis]